MKSFTLTFSLCLACCIMQAQNFVTNPGFETYSTCPTSVSQLTRATGWSSARETGDYFNGCSSSMYVDIPDNFFGYQAPATGQAHAGALAYGSFGSTYQADVREFLYVALTGPLTIGTTYYVAFKVSLADNAEYAVNNIGAQFSTSYSSTFPINNAPHVHTTNVITNKTGWTTILGSFVPTQAYTGLMLGNFFNDANTTVQFVGSVTDIGYNAYYFFDDVYVGTVIPLDIKLGDINARNAGKQNNLYWNTLGEDAGDYFEIERSMDAQTFSKMATVASKYKTGGNYQLADEHPATGINYYRLKMISKDGKYKYSKVVNAQVKEGSFVLETYPNPVDEVLTIRISSVAHGKAMATLVDASGKVIRSVLVTGSKATINMRGLATGNYFYITRMMW